MREFETQNNVGAGGWNKGLLVVRRIGNTPNKARGGDDNAAPEFLHLRNSWFC